MTPHVLVIDEVVYLRYGLYRVVTKRHQAKRLMLFTSNKHSDPWGAVLHDDDLAAAIVDHVLERGRLLHLGGPSLTLHPMPMQGRPQVARISGTNSAEFPEPTAAQPRAYRRAATVGTTSGAMQPEIQALGRAVQLAK